MPRQRQLLCWLLIISIGVTKTTTVLDLLSDPLLNSFEPPAIKRDSTGADAIANSTAPKLNSSSRAQTQTNMQQLDGGETPNQYEKHLVVAQHRENLTWLDQVPLLTHVVYQSDNSSAPRTTVRNMGEAAAYLQYIVDYYNDLPRWMVFVHGHNTSEHQPDKISVLRQLRWGQFEYANLRYENITLGKWGLWTGDYLHPTAPEEGPNRAEVVWDEDRVALSRMYAQLWGLLFETELGPLPEWVHSPCCAEFMVSRERVRLRPLAFYASLLNWLGHTSQDRYNAGLILEYSWHIIFGEPPVYHAPPKCDLLHCSTPEDHIIPLNATLGSNTTNSSSWGSLSRAGNESVPLMEQRHGSRLKRKQQRHLRQQQQKQQDQQQVEALQLQQQERSSRSELGE